MQGKKKLCRMKEKCTQFLAKKDCGFDHVECKYKDHCKDKLKCFFYHKQGTSSSISVPKFDKPKSQALCRFGLVCKKQPNCPFKHDASQPPPKPSQKFNRPCQFGDTCMKPTCAYQHTKKVNISQSKNQNVQSMMGQNVMGGYKEGNGIRGKQGKYFNMDARRDGDSRFCLTFLVNNHCERKQTCQKIHDFTDKGSIKRTYFTTNIPSQHFSFAFLHHLKPVDQGKAVNKQLLFVWAENQSISFRKLISKQNLFEQFGGINPGQHNSLYLRSVLNQSFTQTSIISSIETISFLNKQYMIYIASDILSLVNLSSGSIQRIKLSSTTSTITGCFIHQTNSLMLSVSQQGIILLSFNPSSCTFSPTKFDKLSFSLRKLKICQNEILGQSILYGINVNKIVLLNRQLQHSFVQFGSGVQIHDVQLGLINNQIPVLFVTLSQGRNHRVLLVNLLNLDRQSIMNYEFNAGLGKLLVCQGHLLVQIRNKGFLVFKIGQWEKEIGIIPMINQCQQIKKDSQGNVFIIERTSAQTKGSISIFKFKNA